MDIIELLENDHREVNELFRRFQLAEKPDTLDDLAKQIVHELCVHTAVEEQFVYPYLRLKLDDGSELADRSISEHAQVEGLLADIEKQDAGTAEHTRTMHQVIEAVRRHIEEEEGTIFPQLRDSADQKGLERLASIVEAAKVAVPTHPHPLIPGTATAQLIAGPWAAIVDRARDLVSSSS